MKKTMAIAAAIAASLCLASCTDKPDETVGVTVPPVCETTAFYETDEPVGVITTVLPTDTEEPIGTTEPAVTTEPLVTEEITVTEEPAVTTEPFDFTSGNIGEYVVLGKYLGIEVIVPEADSVSDEQVKEALYSKVLSLGGDVRLKEGECIFGDIVNIDYVGTVGGESFAGGSASDATLIIGDGKYMEGFEEALVGMRVGETKEITLIFSDYHVDLDGKEAKFEVTLNYIYPKLTDGFVKEYFGFETLEEFVADIRFTLEEEANAATMNIRKDAAWTKVMANSLIVGYPQSAVDAAYEEELAYYKEVAEASGMTYQQLLEDVYYITVDEAEDMFAEVAKNNVAQKLLLYAIARDMGIDTSDAAYEARIVGIATDAGFDSLEKFLSASGYSKEYFKELLMREDVLYVIVQNANFVETVFN